MDNFDELDEELELPTFHTSLAEFKFVPASTSNTGVPKLAQNEPTPKSPRLASGGSSSIKRKRADVVNASPLKKGTPSPSKKQKKRGYASPETYAHLPSQLPDLLQPGLDVVFCGINPGCESARSGHHFAHPTNHFWKCLHQGGLTPERIPPSEGATLLDRFSFGLTNLVERPSAEQSELSQQEQTDGVDPFLTKIMMHRPRFVCFVGIKIAKSVFSRFSSLIPRESRPPSNVIPGLQPYKLIYDDRRANNKNATPETLFFVVPSTSGRVIQYQLPDKIKYFSALKQIIVSSQASAGQSASTMKYISVLSSSLKLEASALPIPGSVILLTEEWLDRMEVKMETIKQEEIVSKTELQL